MLFHDSIRYLYPPEAASMLFGLGQPPFVPFSVVPIPIEPLICVQFRRSTLRPRRRRSPVRPWPMGSGPRGRHPGGPSEVPEPRVLEVLRGAGIVAIASANYHARRPPLTPHSS